MDLHTRSATESTPAASGSIPLQASLWRGETPRYAFSGHQTFPFRYAWLPKGVGAVREDPEAFLQPDALVRLGVGKNMVASIRFWCEALGLLEMRGRRGVLTPLGEFLFGAASPATSPAASGRTSRRVHEGAGPLPGRSGHPLATPLAARFPAVPRLHVALGVHALGRERLHARRPRALAVALCARKPHEPQLDPVDQA